MPKELDQASHAGLAGLAAIVSIVVLAAASGLMFALSQPLVPSLRPAVMLAVGVTAVIALGSTFRCRRLLRQRARWLSDSRAQAALNDRRYQAARRLARSAQRAKQEFLGQVSHELRTPLNALIGITQTVLAGELDEGQRGDLNLVLDAALRLSLTVDRHFELAAEQSRARHVGKSRFELRALFSGIRDGLAPRAKRMGVELAWQVQGGVPDVLHGDRNRLERVLRELAGHALQSAHRGEVRVEVSAATLSPSRAVLRFCVKATEGGLSPAARQLLLSPGLSWDDREEAAVGASGVGLLHSKQLVAAMGGELWAIEEPEGGSSLEFTAVFGLPPAAPQRTSAEPPAEPRRRPTADARPTIDRPVHAVTRCRADGAGDGAGDGGGLRVLIADDTPVNLLLARRLLEKRGHSVMAVGDGHQALQAYQRAPYDLLLLDVRMPALDGYAVAREIRTLERQRGGHVPIVAMTAQATQGDRERCLQAGMDGYVAKPIDNMELYQTIESMEGCR